MLTTWFSLGLAETRRPPNVVLIYADDLGWQDAGFAGSDYYETPSLDRLAAEGMVFTSGYAAAGNCAPSRACLMSGQYTPRHGVYAVRSTRRGPVNRMRLEPIDNSEQLAAHNLTLAEALRAAGYATGFFGKWHLGQTVDGTGPENQGFDDVFARHRGESAARDPKSIGAITDAVCDFMERHKGRPFFAYVAHNAVHTPLESRTKTLERFTAKPPGTLHRQAAYAACLSDLDRSVGELLKRLSDLELAESTLVVFTSDNGATPVSSQEPLRGAKGCYYEAGIRVPWIMRWPGVVAAGTHCSLPVIQVDLYPTLLEAAGVSRSEWKSLDGESLLPLMRGERAWKRKAVYWHFPGYLDRPVPRGRDPVFRTRPVSVVRKGDWKLHLYHEEWQLEGGRTRIDENDSVELYNLSEDPGEENNLAAHEKSRRDELLGNLLDWFDKVGAPLPEKPNPAYAP
jgi:arylsulfatase A-like enzyme